MQEVWKDIKGYEGYYQVSNLGRVKSLDRNIHYSNGYTRRHFGKMMRPHLNKGYLSVKLKKNTKAAHGKIHRLVAQSFIPQISLSKDQVNHIDGNKLNNRVDNLEWCTLQENHKHAGQLNLRPVGEKAGRAKLKRSQVIEVLNEYKKGEKRSEIAKKLGVSWSCINRIVQKKSWKHI